MEQAVSAHLLRLLKTNEEALEFMIHHMEENQKHFKGGLEAGFARVDVGN